ncbi:hypothetical protein [Micromonospora robiginosa]|uniref:Uncharacterized protein n=1 Tax=Micromonospora robiginosa TaxID=2749844 RepID=A0A7L6B7E6_9ACTN|nr:hypothetical protein [Micromonospora ferruginea]QLQ37913.1 hypothetical protein H1D33_03190 [Micromonospora ferruginea]
MSGEFSAALRHALDFDTPDRRIDSLKTSVSNFLRSGDQSARVRKTEYFNHTFAPDLVLTWPDERRERLVFLRTNPNPEWLAADLKVIASSHPIMLTLDDSGSEKDSTAHELLVTAAKKARTLITDPDAIEEFVSPRVPITSVLSNAVIRGGLGLIDEQAARGATESAIAGFSAAENLEAGPIRSALVAAEGMLDDEQANRFSRLYRAVWEGQGGTAENFPSHRNLTGPLTGGDLSLLLATLTTADAHFWRRVGRSVRLEQVVALGAESGPNLGYLVEANLDRLLARGARVFGQSGASTSGGQRADWGIERDCLALRGDGWIAYFAARSNDLPPHEVRHGVSVTTLVEGIRQLGVRMTDVKVQQDNFAISIQAVGDADVVDSPDFGQLVDRGDSVAQAAAIAMSSGRNLIADFVTGTAMGHTNASFSLDELAQAAVRLLLELSHRNVPDSDVRLVPGRDPVVIQDPLWE